MITVEDFLEHHGVKGMKWGVRTRSGRNPTKGYSKDAKRAHTIRTKSKTNPAHVKSLSNDEISTFLKRVNLEVQFNQATPSVARRGLNAVKNILGYGKTVNEVATFTNSPSGKAIKDGLNKRRSQKSE